MKSATVAAAFCAGVLTLMAPPSMGADAPAPVRVFDAGELTLSSYTVLKRLWTGSWRASFWIPVHDEPAAAIAALTTEAASLGANAVVNLHCLNDRGGLFRGYTCYGLAIRLK